MRSACNRATHRLLRYATSLFLGLAVSHAVAGAENSYEPIHNFSNDDPNVFLRNLPNIGRLTPGKEVLVDVTGAGRPGGTEPPIVVLNDTGFDITDLKWRLPRIPPEDIRGKPAVGGPVPQNWVQPDIAFKDKNGKRSGGGIKYI